MGWNGNQPLTVNSKQQKRLSGQTVNNRPSLADRNTTRAQIQPDQAPGKTTNLELGLAASKKYKQDAKFPAKSDPTQTNVVQANLSVERTPIVARGFSLNPMKPLIQVLLDDKDSCAIKLDITHTLAQTRASLESKFTGKYYGFYESAKNIIVYPKNENRYTLESFLIDSKGKYQLKLYSIDPKHFEGQPTTTAKSNSGREETKSVVVNSPSNSLYDKTLPNGLLIYKTPAVDSSYAGIQKAALTKTIVVVGPKSVGKTKFIDALMNHVLRVEQHFPHRYHATEGKLSSSGDPIQTNRVVDYQANISKEQLLRVIDTPGFSDWADPEDPVLVMIEDLLKKELDSVDLICFVLNATKFRLTEAQYVSYSRIIKLLADLVPKNVIFILTHADSGKPNIYSEILRPESIFRELKDSITENNILKFNFCSLYQTYIKDSMEEQYWKFSARQLDLFLNRLCHTPTLRLGKPHSKPESARHPGSSKQIQNPLQGLEYAQANFIKILSALWGNYHYCMTRDQECQQEIKSPMKPKASSLIKTPSTDKMPNFQVHLQTQSQKVIQSLKDEQKMLLNTLLCELGNLVRELDAERLEALRNVIFSQFKTKLETEILELQNQDHKRIKSDFLEKVLLRWNSCIKTVQVYSKYSLAEIWSWISEDYQIEDFKCDPHSLD
jgi:signal recognition particle receptor subunit beta